MRLNIFSIYIQLYLDIEDVGDKRVAEGGVRFDEGVSVVVLRLALPGDKFLDQIKLRVFSIEL